MSANTFIEWATKTWNPLLGCDRVSLGCDGCYAIRTATIRAGHPNPKISAAFAGLTERRDGRLDWTGKVNLLPQRLGEPLAWRKSERIFVNSQSDLFHDAVPDEFIGDVFAIMALATQHTFQLLTKRHGRMRSLLSDVGFQGYVAGASARLSNEYQPLRWNPGHAGLWPLPNVWIGVSVENQKWANIRVPALLDTPAAVRWLSCEPLLGPIDLLAWLNGGFGTVAPDLHWAVAGGESGPGARPMHPDWARGLRDQCTAAGMPFFFKQWGEWSPDLTRNWGEGNGRRLHYERAFVRRSDGGRAAAGEACAVMDRVGKKAAGRLLDGRVWDEYPVAVMSR